MRMQAAVLRAGDGPFAVEEVDIAEPGPGQVLVRVAAVGFCHTDVLPRGEGFPARPPIIAGHEGVGVVQALGPGVTEPAVGSHVLLSFDHCGACENCLDGHPAYCRSFVQRNLTGTGTSTESGGGPVTDADGKPVASRWFGQSSFATHAVVDARNTVAVDPDLPLELLAPLGCGVQTGAGSILLALGVRAGSRVVVFGAGGVGLAAVMAARVAGAATIVAVDLHENRLDLAQELGATHVLLGSADGVPRQLRKITGGGADYVLDTTGVPEVIRDGVDSLRVRGAIGLVGAQSRDLVLGPAALSTGKTVTGILEGDAVPRRFLPQLIELWRQGRFPFERLVRTYPLSEINTAERDAASGVTVKPVLLPGS
ncbi:NAD(P)-dependent alcohol dehydrogenase [Streptomyces caniscabiei]|uniref:NAD(P)-dependent alcohol dehydrogenase n=1 Tax=Streptomyces caniscabiei TaxID=2746961 RepID=UPI0029BE9696|nr:NAD(P)-dependent alcohol dehydrogenase [Streptomyces caniscabiei]MDX2600331.1 NAD(P)-dependent alcohol dehydrogenase [Streptomyces caniscabiei]